MRASRGSSPTSEEAALRRSCPCREHMTGNPVTGLTVSNFRVAIHHGSVEYLKVMQVSELKWEPTDNDLSWIDMNVEAGKDCYVRVEIASGALKGHGRLVLMIPEQGAPEVNRLKILGPDKVRDHERVILNFAHK